MSLYYILFSAPDTESYLKRRGDIILIGPGTANFDGDWHKRHFPHHAQPGFNGYQAFHIFEEPISIDGKSFFYHWELAGPDGADFQVFVHETTPLKTREAIRDYITQRRDAVSIRFYEFSTITYMSQSPE